MRARSDWRTTGAKLWVRCKATELGPFHLLIVPISAKAPVVASMLYMETSFEVEFVT